MNLCWTSISQRGSAVCGYGKVYNKILDTLENLNYPEPFIKEPAWNDLQIWYAPLFDYVTADFNQVCEKVLTYSMFESTIIPEGWADFINRFSGFLVPCQWCKDIFVNNGVKVPIDVLHHGVDPVEYPYIERSDSEYFTFLWQGASVKDRKGCDLVLEAYNKLKLKKSRLIIKATPLRTPRYYSQLYGITEIWDFYTHKQMIDLLSTVDMSINPSRGEGFGLIPLEHAATGIYSCATDFSGFKEYIDDIPQIGKINWHWSNVAYLGKKYGKDAAADFDHICHLMEWGYNNRDEVRRLGKEASQAIHERWTWNRPIEQMKVICKKYEG